MANAKVLSLAMKVTADGSSVPKQLTPVERALANLGKEADKATSVLDKLASGSAAAAAAQAKAAGDFEKLAQALANGLNAEDYARQFAALEQGVKDTAAAFEDGLRITEQNRTAEERRAAELEKLSRLLDLGAIDQQTYNRAAAEASGANAEAARAERERADAAAAASRIIQANLTPQEKYDQQMQELAQHLNAGRLSQEQFNRAADKARSDLNAVGNEAGKADAGISQLGRSLKVIAAIEIGRVIVDGIQLISNAVSRVGGDIASLVTSVNSSLDTLNDFSARTGIGVEALQGYSLAAKLAGVDTEAFGTAVQKLAVNIGKATPGDNLDKSLRQINLSVAELRALSPEQQFSEIGDAISQLPTAADRAAAAVEIFGKQGAALAPLFRDGSASIEELKQEAQRLGIIVSQTQIDNVAKMNDGFDKVLATVQGIVGQVLGNLAPAVTDVTKQFLEFVKTFEGTGAQGTGGSGIANAITDTLLRGADYFAGIFDKFVASFDGFNVSLEYTGEVFSVVGNLIAGVAETLRVVFNVFESIGNALMLGLGKFLEGIGSWVSDDLEQAGMTIAASARESIRQNEIEAQSAAKNAADAFNAAFGGGTANAEQRGQGAAQNYLRGLKEEIERSRLPEVKVATNLDESQQRLEAYFKSAGDGADETLKKSMETLDIFKEQVKQGELLPVQIQIMNGFMDQLNQKLDEEIAKRQEAADAAAKQAEADQKRIEGLLQTNDAAGKIQEDLDAVTREIQRAEEAQAAARDAGNADAANAAAARVTQLDQVQAQLEENLQAAEQGFGEAGFGPAFEAINSGLNDAAAQAAEFGNAGAEAFARLQEGVAQAQEQAKDGILNKEGLDQQVAAQQKAFEQEIKNIEDAAKRREEVQKEVDQMIFDSLDKQQQAQIKAAENLAKLEEEKANVQKQLQAAQDAGDKEAIKAANQRIAQIDKVAAKERDIASGAAGQREKFLEQQKAIQDAQQKQRQAAEEQQKKIFEEQQKAAEAEYNRQVERITALNTLGSRTVQTADVRTQEGAAIVLGLAADAQDPQLIQARLTNKLLQRIAAGIDRDLTRLGQPVTIL